MSFRQTEKKKKKSVSFVCLLFAQRQVGKVLLVNIARDVDLTGSGRNSLCTEGAKELKLTPAGNQNSSMEVYAYW